MTYFFSVLRLCGSRQVVAHCRADERIKQMQLLCPALESRKWSGDHYAVRSQVRPKTPGKPRNQTKQKKKSVLRLCGSRQVVAHCRADERIVQMQLLCSALGSQKWSKDYYAVQCQVRPKRNQKQTATKQKPHKNTKNNDRQQKQRRGP